MAEADNRIAGTPAETRVHELAKELGVTSREILAKCSDYGEFIKSASHTLPPRLIRRLRHDLGPGAISARHYGDSADINQPADDGGFGAAYQRAQRASRSTPSHSHKPGEIESAIYRYVIDPHRTNRGGHTPEQRDRAERLTNQWANTWLPDMIDWIRVTGGERSDIAAKLSAAGLTPADADLRLMGGRIDPTRDTIVTRVMKGHLGIKDAVRQVQEFRRSEQSAAGGA